MSSTDAAAGDNPSDSDLGTFSNSGVDVAAGSALLSGVPSAVIALLNQQIQPNDHNTAKAGNASTTGNSVGVNVVNSSGSIIGGTGGRNVAGEATENNLRSLMAKTQHSIAQGSKIGKQVWYDMHGSICICTTQAQRCVHSKHNTNHADIATNSLHLMHTQGRAGGSEGGKIERLVHMKALLEVLLLSDATLQDDALYRAIMEQPAFRMHR